MDINKFLAITKLTCYHCNKIVLRPYRLPCWHVFCFSHLTNEKVLTENSIKCMQCKKIFEVRNNPLIMPDLEIENAIVRQEYLNKFERNFRYSLILDIKSLDKHSKEIINNMGLYELKIHDHFSEIRFLIDIRREEIKDDAKKVDGSFENIYIEMIDSTKLYEKMNIKNIFKRLMKPMQKINSKTFDENLNDIDQLFRELYISDFQLNLHKNELLNKLISIKKIKDQVPLLIKLIKERNTLCIKDAFIKHDNNLGVLNLHDLWEDPFESLILNLKQSFDILKLCEFAEKKLWVLLYRGSRDGFSSREFHLKCDGKSNTLTVIKEKVNRNPVPRAGGQHHQQWPAYGDNRVHARRSQ